MEGVVDPPQLVSNKIAIVGATAYFMCETNMGYRPLRQMQCSKLLDIKTRNEILDRFFEQLGTASMSEFVCIRQHRRARYCNASLGRVL
jgi:hypothetical protein